MVKREKEAKGTCINYTIKVEKDQEVGKAVLKAWDKNSKKEYKVVVTKVKESDHSFVKILAEVITILLDKSISGEGWSQMKSKNTVKCEICDKCFSSASYLKGHVTKIHKEVTATVIEGKTCTKCRKKFTTEWNFKSHMIVCKRKTEPHGDISKTNMTPKPDKEDQNKKQPQTEEKRTGEPTSEKFITIQCDKCTLVFNNDLELKKHVLSEHHSQARTCYDCDMNFERMSALELLVVQRQHEDNDCLVKKQNIQYNQYECDDCEFRSHEESHLRKHKKDMHEHKDVFVTPPYKKRKKEKDDEEEQQEEMELDVTDEITKQLEKIGIHDKEEEQTLLKDLSNKQDEKVLLKRKKIDEEEAQYTEKKEIEEEKKRKREVELSVNGNKNKKANKKKLNEKKVVEKKPVELPKGVREIDKKYHSLVGENNIKYPGPFNGNCQGASKAALLFQDPSKGPELSIQENEYLRDHWKYFKDSITFPHTILEGGGKSIIFKDENDFHKYLTQNPKSSYMWGDQQQLQITANTYNAKINVLTIDKEGNGTILKDPFVPDKRLTDHANLKSDKTEMIEMWLLYTNGNHYDALIKKTHPLITMGTMEDMGVEKEVIKENVKVSNIFEDVVSGEPDI